jgi:hypothetical protein
MFGQILDLADKLDIIKTVKAKLLRQPDPAADKLVAVLGELSKIGRLRGRAAALFEFVIRSRCRVGGGTGRSPDT